MKADHMKSILDGSGFLETKSGNLYEYCGIVNGKYYFQNVNNQTENSWLFLTEHQLLNSAYFDYQKKRSNER